MEGLKNAVMDRCSLIAFDCQPSSKFAIYTLYMYIVYVHARRRGFARLY